MRKRGLFFTLAVLLLVIPLMLFISFYATMQDTKVQDTISKVRCDELHYFVEDINTDMSRAMVIFGRRASIYAIDHIVEEDQSLDGYVFNCTKACDVNCSSFGSDMNGSTAALSELMVCGTLYGDNITYMVNHTLSQWLRRMEDRGNEMHFNTTLSITEIHLAQHDPWGFTVFVNTSFQVFDMSETCFFDGTDRLAVGETSILGVEDPSFALHTESKVIKFFENCSPTVRSLDMAGCSESSDPGQGVATGSIVFHSDIKSDYGGLDNYCLMRPASIVSGQILVLDQAFGGCNQYDEMVCFNASHPNSFAGVINYGPVSSNAFANKCNVTIPWITDTGDMDEYSPNAPPLRVPECGTEQFADADCVHIINEPTCGAHIVFLGTDAQKINTTCYRVSNVSLYGDYPDGPSFFGRLEGRSNLSEVYINLSKRYFNVTLIGLETLVDPYDLDARGLPVRFNATWVDYLYWDWVYGCEAQGSCPEMNFFFRLDDPHASMYSINTDCKTVEICPPTEEFCINGEDEDEDAIIDWLDYDCSVHFAQCGSILACDPSDTDQCSTCYNASMATLPEDSQFNCSNYGYNTSEWHYYRMDPSSWGSLRIVFNGTSNVTDTEQTELNIYNWSLASGCGSQVEKHENIEPDFETVYCVQGGETYIIGLDVDAPRFGYNGSYELRTTLTPNDPSCPVLVSTSTTSTSTSTSSSSSSSSTSTSSITCSDIEVDNADGSPTFTESGNWRTSSSTAGYYATDFDHDRNERRDPSKSATFTPDISAYGWYSIYMWWPEDSNRPNHAPLTIVYDGGIDSDRWIDQTTNGSQWNYIGTYRLDVGTNGYVRLEADDYGYTIADAVKFECQATSTSSTTTTTLPTNPTIPGCIEVIIDNVDGSPEYTESGSWNSATFWPGYYGSNYRHDGRWQADPSKSATFTPNLAIDSPYNVYIWWSEDDRRPNHAPLSIVYDGGTDDTKWVDQTDDGGQWNLIGRYNFTSGTAGSVTLSASDYGYTTADAIKFECV